MTAGNRQLLVFSVVAIGLTVASARAQMVERVIDGDTLTVSGIGAVRLIGVDAPETVDPRKLAQYVGKEAEAFLRRLVEGKQVRLERDFEGTDKYGRTLAYVYLQDGTFVNAEIVRQGYAHAYTRFPFRHLEQFRALEREAREADRGLWAGGSALAPATYSVAASVDASETVYVTRTGQKYHRAGCRHLARSQIPMPLKEAAARYGPCGVCKPPLVTTVPVREPAPLNNESRSAAAPAALGVSGGLNQQPDDKVVVITGNNFSGLYHWAGCDALKGSTGLIAVSPHEAESRWFRPHDACQPFVYVQAGPSFYHRKDCRTLVTPNPIAWKLNQVGAYTPCPVCRPPAVAAAGAASDPGRSASESTATPSVAPSSSAPPSSQPQAVTRCQATTRKGTQCSRNAKAGSRYCWQHGG